MSFPQSGALRFAWLSDSHVVSPINPCLRRVNEWGSRELQDQNVDACILGGDITHQTDSVQADAFLSALHPGQQPLYFLPGNNEGPDLAENLIPHHPRLLPVQGCTRLPWPGHAFALATYDTASHLSAVADLAAKLPQQGSVLVLALPPRQRRQRGPRLTPTPRCTPVLDLWAPAPRINL